MVIVAVGKFVQSMKSSADHLKCTAVHVQNFRVHFTKWQQRASLRCHSLCRGDPLAKLSAEILGQSHILHSSPLPRTSHWSYLNLCSKLYTPIT